MSELTKEQIPILQKNREVISLILPTDSETPL